MHKYSDKQTDERGNKEETNSKIEKNRANSQIDLNIRAHPSYIIHIRLREWRERYIVFFFFFSLLQRAPPFWCILHLPHRFDMARDSNVLNTAQLFFIFLRSSISSRLIQIWTFFCCCCFVFKNWVTEDEIKTGRIFVPVCLFSSTAWFLRFLQHKRSAGYCKELITYRKFLEKIQKPPPPKKKHNFKKSRRYFSGWICWWRWVRQRRDGSQDVIIMHTTSVHPDKKGIYY